jgi:hypothetical protein
VLFIRAGNSARGIKTEVSMYRLGWECFKANREGNHLRYKINQMTLEVVSDQSYDSGGLRCKSWTESVGTDAPQRGFFIKKIDRMSQQTELPASWASNRNA